MLNLIKTIEIPIYVNSVEDIENSEIMGTDPKETEAFATIFVDKIVFLFEQLSHTGCSIYTVDGQLIVTPLSYKDILILIKEEIAQPN
ncbi:MAG: hypothetical protein WBG58_15970 [Ignavibacteriaceae bacterium]